MRIPARPLLVVVIVALALSAIVTNAAAQPGDSGEVATNSCSGDRCASACVVNTCYPTCNNSYNQTIVNTCYPTCNNSYNQTIVNTCYPTCNNSYNQTIVNTCYPTCNNSYNQTIVNTCYPTCNNSYNQTIVNTCYPTCNNSYKFTTVCYYSVPFVRRSLEDGCRPGCVTTPGPDRTAAGQGDSHNGIDVTILAPSGTGAGAWELSAPAHPSFEATVVMAGDRPATAPISRLAHTGRETSALGYLGSSLVAAGAIALGSSRRLRRHRPSPD